MMLAAMLSSNSQSLHLISTHLLSLAHVHSTTARLRGTSFPNSSFSQMHLSVLFMQAARGDTFCSQTRGHDPCTTSKCGASLRSLNIYGLHRLGVIQRNLQRTCKQMLS